MDQAVQRGRLPRIVVTGASGFVGRYFVEHMKDRAYVYAVARRNQAASGVASHENIRWMRIDIVREDAVDKMMKEIASEGPVDFFFHFAAYYDFSNRPSAEYQHTNVNGTKYLLDRVELLGVKRFIFASSLTVHEFFRPGTVLDESSPLDAHFPYADTKRECEAMAAEYSVKFPCAVVRLAAIYSDLCEYGPLYVFLRTWLSKRLDASVLAGGGETAVPYLHVQDLNRLWMRIMTKTADLPPFTTVIASPDGCTSHNELFEIATTYFYGKPKKPFYLPVWLAAAGVALKSTALRLVRVRPFERVWMLKYVDKKMLVDSRASQRLLDWKPLPRLGIRRRLLFLVENMKSNRAEWEMRNHMALHKRYDERPNFRIYEAMERHRAENIMRKISILQTYDKQGAYRHYLRQSTEELWNQIDYTYRLIASAVHSGDRRHILLYAQNVAKERFLQGFDVHEVTSSIKMTGQIILESLYNDPSCSGLKQMVYDEIMMTTQLIMDEIEEVFYHMSEPESVLLAEEEMRACGGGESLV